MEASGAALIRFGSLRYEPEYENSAPTQTGASAIAIVVCAILLSFGPQTARAQSGHGNANPNYLWPEDEFPQPICIVDGDSGLLQQGGLRYLRPEDEISSRACELGTDVTPPKLLVLVQFPVWRPLESLGPMNDQLRCLVLVTPSEATGW